MAMAMAKYPWKHGNKKQSVLFLVLILTLAVFGQDQDDNDNGDDNEYDYNSNPNEETTTVGPRMTTTVSPEAARENRIVEQVLAKLNVTLGKINFNIEKIQSRLGKIETAGSRSSPPGSAPTRSSTIFTASDNVQTNTRMIQQLQNLVLSLKNQTENSQSYNKTSADILEMSTHFQTELMGMGIRLDNLANDLTNQNLENLQIAFTRLSRLDQFMDSVEREKKEEKRVKVVKNLLEAWRNEQNDMVKALLNDITNENQLNSSIAEIVEGMFDGNIRNYPKIVALFQPTTSEQYRAGLTSLIDLFHKISSSGGSGSKKGAAGTSSSRSLLDEPEYLNLAYLAKSGFGTELKFKFPTLVQNLVFANKVCVRNLLSNYYLSVDRVEGLKDGGYSVSARKQSTNFPRAVLCDWEITSPNAGASFIIRRRSQAETLNLNVMEETVYAGSFDYNPSYFWKIHLRGNAQKVAVENIAASSEDPSYFLCSVKALNKTEKAVPFRKLTLWRSEQKTCEWTIEPSQ